MSIALTNEVKELREQFEALKIKHSELTGFHVELIARVHELEKILKLPQKGK